MSTPAVLLRSLASVAPQIAAIRPAPPSSASVTSTGQCRNHSRIPEPTTANVPAAASRSAPAHVTENAGRRTSGTGTSGVG